MGLDMYLNKRSYVEQWDHNEKNHTVKVKFDGKARKDIKPDRITYVTEGVIYWRKVNHIHNWFITNCADGVDDCTPMYVSVEQLRELCELCDEVLTDPSAAHDRFPTISKFFFGDTSYDDYYIDETKRTHKQLKSLLKEYDDCKGKGFHPSSFEYLASW